MDNLMDLDIRAETERRLQEECAARRAAQHREYREFLDHPFMRKLLGAAHARAVWMTRHNMPEDADFHRRLASGEWAYNIYMELDEEILHEFDAERTARELADGGAGPVGERDGRAREQIHVPRC